MLITCEWRKYTGKRADEKKTDITILNLSAVWREDIKNFECIYFWENENFVWIKTNRFILTEQKCNKIKFGLEIIISFDMICKSLYACVIRLCDTLMLSEKYVHFKRWWNKHVRVVDIKWIIDGWCCIQYHDTHFERCAILFVFVCRRLVGWKEAI